MPQAQLNALIAVAHQLPEIAKQLKIANELKALELKRTAGSSVKALYELTAEIDNIMKGE